MDYFIFLKKLAKHNLIAYSSLKNNKFMPDLNRRDENRNKNIKMHQPGIEPGSTAWKAIILPLNHRCLPIL